MTKTIDTLVSDIYSVLDNGKTVPPEDAQALGGSLADLIVSRLDPGGWNYVKTPALRLSNLGKPLRQLWYEIRHPELGEPLKASSRLNFLIGDIYETVVLFLTRLAGHTVTDEQKQVELHGVRGRIDAVIDDTLCDVKSASGRSYDKFCAGLEEDPFGYTEQLGAYREALGRDTARFVVCNKETGPISVQPVHDSVTSESLRARVETVRDALDRDDPPERCYDDTPDGKSGNRKLRFQCSYCQFKYPCWEDSNGGQGLRKFNYSKGPVYLTHVERQPEVFEVAH